MNYSKQYLSAMSENLVMKKIINVFLSLVVTAYVIKEKGCINCNNDRISAQETIPESGEQPSNRKLTARTTK